MLCFVGSQAIEHFASVQLDYDVIVLAIAKCIVNFSGPLNCTQREFNSNANETTCISCDQLSCCCCGCLGCPTQQDVRLGNIFILSPLRESSLQLPSQIDPISIAMRWQFNEMQLEDAINNNNNKHRMLLYLPLVKFKRKFAIAESN